MQQFQREFQVISPLALSHETVKDTEDRLPEFDEDDEDDAETILPPARNRCTGR